MAFGLVLLATLIGFGTGVALLVTGAGIVMSIIGFYSVSLTVVGALLLRNNWHEQRAAAVENSARFLKFIN